MILAIEDDKLNLDNNLDVKDQDLNENEKSTCHDMGTDGMDEVGGQSESEYEFDDVSSTCSEY